MRNFYNCGCYTADDVPIISRCAEHNGWVIARTDASVTNPRQLVLGKRKRLKIIHHNIYTVLENLSKPLDLIFAYPEFSLFATQHQLSPFGFRNSRMEIFNHVMRLLKPEGQAIFLIDPIDLGSIAYQCNLRKLDFDTRFFPAYIKNEPLFSKQIETHKVYKIAVGINTGPLPRLRLNDLTSFFDALDVPDEARILDLSCIHLSAVQAARPDAKIVGIVEDATRYRRFYEAAAAAARNADLGTDTADSSDSASPRKKRRKRS